MRLNRDGLPEPRLAWQPIIFMEAGSVTPRKHLGSLTDSLPQSGPKYRVAARLTSTN